MHGESTTGTISPISRNGVLTLRGFGVRVTVDRGCLTVEDGRGRERRSARFPRITRELKRLIIIGHTGTISFEALRWLTDRGCSFLQVDSDGTILAAFSPVGSDDARLRRAQSFASLTETGITIARDLLSRKLDSQASILDALSERDSADSVRQARNTLGDAQTIPALRLIEAQAAATYWAGWSSIPIQFARKVADRVPDHWQRFGMRTSPLTSSPRLASNPINAILNYLYALLEAECRFALLAVGLDPGIGVMHADQRNRDSLACDVMEAVRPTVDHFALDFIASRHFGPGDFFETRQGGCRLMPSVTRPLADTSPMWAEAVAPIVESIARTLHRDAELSGSRTTPLTQANRSAGRDRIRKKAERKHTLREPMNLSSGELAADASSAPTRMRQSILQTACLECGTILDNRSRKYCDTCLEAASHTQRTQVFGLAGSQALAKLRASGIDPAHGGNAATARGESNSARQKANLKWMESHDQETDPEQFAREILPGLQSVTLQKMANATGLTKGYCSFIRRGIHTPHPRHWEALKELAREKNKSADRS